MSLDKNNQGRCVTIYSIFIPRISELIHRRQKLPWLWPDFIYYNIPPGKQFKRCLKILHNFTVAVRHQSFCRLIFEHYGFRHFIDLVAVKTKMEE